MNVSLVLATLGRVDEINRLVDTLIAQSKRCFEVIVVDQNPDDRLLPVVARAKALGLEVVHLRQVTPNLATARNRGIAMARHEIVAFPDDDCWYEPDTIACIIASFQKSPSLQGAVACWVEQTNASGQPAQKGYLQLNSWQRFRGGNASSISLFLRRSLLEELDGFDTRLGVGQWFGAAEETDLILRALTTGAELAPCPSAKVHHAFGTKPANDWRIAFRNARCRARGTGALYAKHRLSPYVILRGFTAPIFLPLLKAAGVKAMASGLATTLGRIEGWSRWSRGRL